MCINFLRKQSTLSLLQKSTVGPTLWLWTEIGPRIIDINEVYYITCSVSSSYVVVSCRRITYVVRKSYVLRLWSSSSYGVAVCINFKGRKQPGLLQKSRAGNSSFGPRSNVVYQRSVPSDSGTDHHLVLLVMSRRGTIKIIIMVLPNLGTDRHPVDFPWFTSDWFPLARALPIICMAGCPGMVYHQRLVLSSSGTDHHPVEFLSLTIKSLGGSKTPRLRVNPE